MGRIGPTVETIGWTSDRTSPLAVADGHPQTLYSFTFDLSNGTNFAVILLGAGTTINIKIELEQGAVLPTTQAAADATNYVVPNGLSDVKTALTTTTLYITSISPVALRYGRLKVSTIGAGSANQTLTAYLSKLEDI